LLYGDISDLDFMASVVTSIDEWPISMNLEGNDSGQSEILFLNLYGKTAKNHEESVSKMPMIRPNLGSGISPIQV
jgi:hypothetical protein